MKRTHRATRTASRTTRRRARPAQRRATAWLPPVSPRSLFSGVVAFFLVGQVSCDWQGGFTRNTPSRDRTSEHCAHQTQPNPSATE